MWFGLAKMALQAGAKVYSNKQRTKMAMSDAALLHAERMARGEESYQGKLLEARQNDFKGRIRPFGYFGADHRARLGSF